MKILTTNFVQCAVVSCSGKKDAFPLTVNNPELELVETEYDLDMVISAVKRLEWKAFVKTLNDLGKTSAEEPWLDREENITEDELKSNEELSRKLHEILFEIRIISGSLVCNNCGYSYLIKDSIPNFLLPAHLA